MYQKYYKEFINNHKGLQHFAAHSHHFWPDVTKNAIIEYWELASQRSDKKWSYILGEKIPDTQKRIASRLSLSDPSSICFAPNTHDLIIRLLSCFKYKERKIKILTTDSEFHSFKRQIQIMSQQNLIELDVIPTIPYNNLNERLEKQLSNNDYDILFISHVFFNSGVVLENIEDIAALCESKGTTFVLDGYHSFMALPINLSLIEDKVFFIAGSYKYAQAGEGCCFMTIPKNFIKNPLISGWFADFENLDSSQVEISYSQDGYRFAGSTMDYSALFKLNAVLKLFDENHITEIETHNYVQLLQKNFIKELNDFNHPLLSLNNLIHNDLSHHGHFYAFKFENNELCQSMHKFLEKNNILTDYRGNILRFGFGIYQDEKISFKGLI